MYRVYFPEACHVEIEATGEFTSKGPAYRASLLEGPDMTPEVLCEATDPEHAACRALAAMGHTGTVYFWRPGRSFWSIRMDIEKGAGMCVIETPTRGPGLGTYRGSYYKELTAVAEAA